MCLWVSMFGCVFDCMCACTYAHARVFVCACTSTCTCFVCVCTVNRTHCHCFVRCMLQCEPAVWLWLRAAAARFPHGSALHVCPYIMFVSGVPKHIPYRVSLGVSSTQSYPSPPADRGIIPMGTVWLISIFTSQVLALVNAAALDRHTL